MNDGALTPKKDIRRFTNSLTGKAVGLVAGTNMARLTYWTEDDLKALDELNQAATLLNEWVGEGGYPVDENQANQRASICINCPMNQRGDWWATSKTVAATLARKTLELRINMRMRLDADPKLHVCAVCGCVLRLKVHVPIEFAASSLTAEQESNFRKHHCWITSEKDSHHEL
jgi:hypothetical protein